VLKKKIWANFQRIVELFTQKIVTKLSKIWVWDPGSGKKPIPDPGSRSQKGTGSQIRIRNTDKNELQYIYRNAAIHFVKKVSHLTDAYFFKEHKQFTLSLNLKFCGEM
jgi:hypothetical protein